MRDIGKNIKLLRQQKNMTQDELAEALFVTRQTVSNYETGRSRPDVEMLLKIAEVLEADANTVLYGPPVPQSRKDAWVKTAVGLGLTVVLGICLSVLIASVRKAQALYYDQGWNMVLIRGWLVPGWKLLAGSSVMWLLHMTAGVNRLKKTAAQYVRFGVLAVIGLYVLLILPMSIYMIRSSMEVALLRQAGGDYSYTSSFSFVPFWDRAAMILMTRGGYYPQVFVRYLLQAILAAWPFVAGALLWLGGSNKKKEEIVQPDCRGDQ